MKKVIHRETHPPTTPPPPPPPKKKKKKKNKKQKRINRINKIKQIMLKLYDNINTLKKESQKKTKTISYIARGLKKNNIVKNII